MHELKPHEITYDDIIQLTAESFGVIHKLNKNYRLSYNAEFFDGFYNDVAGFIKKSISGFGEWFATIKNKTPDPIVKFHNFDQYKKSVEKLCQDPENYLRFSAIEVPYMNGCKVNYLEFVNRLCNIPRNHQEITLKVLDRLDTHVSFLIANEDTRKTHKPFVKDDTFKEAEEFVNLVRSLNEFLIDPQLYKDTILFEHMVQNLTELRDSGNQLQELSKHIYKDTLSSILRKTESVSQKTTLFSNSTLIDGKTLTSKAQIDGLKVQLELAANLVTAVSTYYYFVSQAVSIYKQLPDVLK